MRRVLSRKISIEAMLEFLMWAAIPYLVIGLAWTFFHPEQVQLLENQLLLRVPAGANLVSFGLVTLLWPVQVLGASFCVACG